MSNASGSAGSAIGPTTAFVLVFAVAAASVAGVDPEGWFPFAVAKWWLVVVAVLVASAVVLWRRWPTRSAPGVPLLVLLCIITLSAATALDGWYAWFGTPVRHLGVAAWWLFGLAFVVGSAVGDRRSLMCRRSVAPVARAMISVAAVLGVYIVWELVVGRPIDYAADSQRLGGPYGSAAYLGAACCLFLPIAALGVVDRDLSPSWRVLGAVGAIGCGLGVAGSGSRAAAVALLATLLVVAVIRRGATGRDERTRIIAAAGLLVIAAAVAIAVARRTFERTAGWSSRVDEWTLAIRVIAERPVLGTGPEGYRIASFELVEDSYVRRYGDETLVDRAHSGVLDVAAASGLLAAIAYIAVIGLVGRSAMRTMRQGSPVEVGIACAVLAYAIGQQLLFPVAEIDPLFWLLAGVVCVGAEPQRAWRGDRWCAAPRIRRGVGVALLLAAAATTVVGVREVAADRLSSTAIESTDRARGADLAGRASELAPYDTRHLLLVSRLASEIGTVRGVDVATGALDDARRMSPRDPAVRIEGARIASLRASITGTANDRTVARVAWDDLVADAPACARCHLGAGLAAYERGEIEAAARSFERAASLGNRDAVRLLEQLGIER
ncbi:MAG: O-antigen ligase family protein [Actinomycetota bacterium]